MVSDAFMFGFESVSNRFNMFNRFLSVLMGFNIVSNRCLRCVLCEPPLEPCVLLLPVS